MRDHDVYVAAATWREGGRNHLEIFDGTLPEGVTTPVMVRARVLTEHPKACEIDVVYMGPKTINRVACQVLCPQAVGRSVSITTNRETGEVTLRPTDEAAEP